jgi:hypothetical protein|tara:strand:+ start:152 stop:517 length:366 start_codon:yes stop_codon:yes gene_type:complete
MAGPKDKRKKTKRISRTDKDGNRIVVTDSPNMTYTNKKYKPGGKKSGVAEFSIIDKTGKGKSFSAREKTLDTKPNKRVREIQYTDKPRQKTVVTRSTQAGNSESDYKIAPNKKSGAGYSGD